MRASSARRAEARNGGQRGQSLVELAIATVFIMVAMSGLLDLSRAFHYTIGLQGAVRAGARHGAFFISTTTRQAYLDDTDIKAAVDQVLAGDGLNASTLKTVTGCLTPSDSNVWGDPPYPASAYPTTANTPTLYICYDTQGAKLGTMATAPAAGSPTYTGTDLLVVLLDRYGLIGGLSAEYLKSGSGLASIQLTAYQHFAVQG